SKSWLPGGKLRREAEDVRPVLPHWAPAWTCLDWSGRRRPFSMLICRPCCRRDLRHLIQIFMRISHMVKRLPAPFLRAIRQPAIPAPAIPVLIPRLLITIARYAPPAG